MAHMEPLSNKNTIKLKDRLLCFDGDSVLSEDEILNYILANGPNLNDIYTISITDEIKRFNQTNQSNITQKTHCVMNDVTWELPPEIKTLNVKQLVYDRLTQELQLFNGQMEKKQRQLRVDMEWALFNQKKLISLLTALIYIINTFIDKNIIWGVGRGSATSSYILYLIGVHDVDSVKYQLDIMDFFHEES